MDSMSGEMLFKRKETKDMSQEELMVELTRVKKDLADISKFDNGESFAKGDPGLTETQSKILDRISEVDQEIARRMAKGTIN